MRILPVVFNYREVQDRETGEIITAMVPQSRYAKVAKRQYVLGEEYPLVPLEARSRASHSAYFAQINEAFDNLPESIAARWPSAEHLRKWLLVETGWFEEKEYDFDTERDALRLANFIRTEDEYARIFKTQVGPKKWKVIVRRAKSQSAASMAKQAFEDSKKAVLDALEHEIGLARGQLKKHAGRSA